ncbi:unnamed protein product [Cylicocyclus nassatus]|uniref:Gem-associated protein 8 n=1 Tax=Cylicocyclus nassatus TaxID=53992 RepID=A0AA36GU29_CYLNA|nr:unnamed protein product [Cylicocyclus nassatus]
MEIYHNQEWARDERYSSFWAHYMAVEKWRLDHAKMAEVACRVVRGKAKPYQRRKTGPRHACKSSPVKSVSTRTDFEAATTENDDVVHENIPRTSAPLEEEEMSEEMVAFFRKTIAHRKSRAAEKAEEKRLEAEEQGDGQGHWIRLNNDDYVMADKIGVYGVGKRTFATPDEAAKTQQRRDNAKMMYGSAAERILAMETLVDMRFEQEYAKKRPPLWPNIPLKF